MKKIAPIGRMSTAGKRFKSPKPNELSASDKNSIRNNINTLTKQQLAFRVGKPLEVIEKFIKKEKLVSILDIQLPREQPQPVAVEPIKAVPIIVEAPTKPDVTVSTTKTKERKKKDVLTIVEVPAKPDVTVSATKERKKSAIAARKIDFILKHYKQHTAIEMAKMLNTSITSVRYHLKCLNIKSVKPVLPTPSYLLERQKFIQENHEKYTVKEFAEKFNCSGDVIRDTLYLLKIKPLRKPLSQAIPQEVIQFLKANYRTMTAREMSNALGTLSWTQIKYLCEKHGFLKTPEETEAIRNRWNRSEFTASEEKYILKNYGKISFSEIAQNLKRTRSSVVKFASRKGLKITKEQHNALNKKNFERAREMMKPKLETEAVEKK